MTDSSSDRDPLDRLAEEFLARYRAGERPSVAEFARRLPDRGDEVLELFPALVEMEQLKPVSGDQTADYTVPPPESRHPTRVGDFRIIRLVGRGGMGAVYEAVQESLGRHVALKLLPTDSLADQARLERFRREARAAAQLHHTNIVPVFGVGEADGRHFYAMQFISGHPLDAVIDEVRQLKGKSAVGGQRAVSEVAVALMTGTLANAMADHPLPALTGNDQPGHANGSENASNPTLLGSLSDGGRHYWTAIARLGSQVADALSYAHAQGVLHRDIKPANLLLDLHGTVWVADFGLAKSNDSDNLTQTGDVVGTLRYLAPERFDGAGDHRADIYAIGLTLYELLTLRPAFQAETRAKLVEQVLAANPPMPRSIDPNIPRDLETVVLKAIARDPLMRYQSAAALAEDLRRYIEDRPVRARRATSGEQFVRWCRRNPAVAALLATVLIVTTAGAGVASFFAVRAENERAKAVVREREAIALRQQATAAKTTAESMAEEARKRLVRLYVSTGATLQDSGDKSGALLWFHRAWEQDHTDPLADAAHRARIAGVIWEMPEVLGACFHKTKVCDAIFSPDGQRVLTRTDGNEAYIWDYAKAQQTCPPLVHSGRVRHITYSPDGKSIATASADGTACVWDAATGAKRFTLKHDGPLTWVAFHPDGKRIATSAEDKTVRLWSAADGKPLVWKLPVEAVIDHLAFSPDGTRMLTSGRDNTARVWDVASAKAISPVLPHLAPTEEERYRFNQDMWPKFAPDGKAVISFDYRESRNRLHIWAGGETDQVQAVIFPAASRLPGRVLETYFIPGSDKLLINSRYPEASIVRLKPAEIIHRLSHPRNANLGAASPDGKWVLTGSSGGLVTLWDAATGKPSGTPKRCGDFCSALLFSPDSSRFLASSQDGTVRVWATAPRLPQVLPYRSDCGRVDRVARQYLGYSEKDDPKHTPNYRTYSADLQRWIDWREGGRKVTLAGKNIPKREIPHSGPITFASFCDDGSQIVIAGSDAIRAWKTDTLTPAGPVLTVKAQFDGAALSRDGTRMLCKDDEKTMSVFDLESGERVFGPARHRAPGPLIFGDSASDGWAIARLSPDGERLAVGIQSSGTLSVWDVKTGKMLHHNRRFRGYIRVFGFSDDGERILLSASDNIARVYDTNTGKPMGPALRMPSPPAAIAVDVSPDGRRVVFYDGSAKGLRVVDVERGERILTIATDSAYAGALWFNPAGTSIIASNGDDITTLPLPEFSVSLADSASLVQFLTGQQIDETDGIEFIDQFTFSKAPEHYRDVFMRWKKSQEAFDARLPEVQRYQRITSARNLLLPAMMANLTSRHAAAAKLYADALALDPTLAEDRQVQHRYNAACAAALAGCGQGKDDPAPDIAARTKLREQARAWLQDELAAWTKLLDSSPSQAPTIVEIFQHWKKDAVLAGVRDAKALEALPEAERTAWHTLWTGVDALLTRAKAAAPAGEKK